MEQLGMGVMINMLGGNEKSVNALKSVIGKIIKKVFLDKDANWLRFEFEDGVKFHISDEGQSCCETRYMNTDDELDYFVGAVFTGAALKEAPNVENEWGEHEVQFLEIQTNRGVFTCSNHNEHNGYYGGFWIVCSIE